MPELDGDDDHDDDDDDVDDDVDDDDDDDDDVDVDAYTLHLSGKAGGLDGENGSSDEEPSLRTRSKSRRNAAIQDNHDDLFP